MLRDAVERQEQALKLCQMDGVAQPGKPATSTT